jgi:hypothetical protein
MNPVYERKNVITQTQKTDEEIFREENLVRLIEITEDLRKNVQTAFYECRNKNSFVTNEIKSMANDMQIESKSVFANMIGEHQIKLQKISEPDLKNMQKFFNANLSLETRKKLITLFPIKKETLKVVEISLISSLVRDIQTIVDCLPQKKIAITSISWKMGLHDGKLELLLKNKVDFLKRDQIESIRKFARDNFKNLLNIEDRYPILFSKKLLEIDDNTLFVNSEASDPASLIQDSVSNFQDSVSNFATPDNASKTNPNKRSFDQSGNNDKVNSQHRKKPLIPVKIRNDIRKGYELCKDLSKKNSMKFISTKMKLATPQTLMKIIQARPDGSFSIKNLPKEAYKDIKAAFVEILTLEVCKKELTALFPPSSDDSQVFISPNRNSVNEAIESEGAKTNVAINNNLLSLSNNLFKPLPPLSSLPQQVQQKIVTNYNSQDFTFSLSPLSYSSNQQEANEVTPIPLPPQIPQENNIAIFPEGLGFWNAERYAQEHEINDNPVYWNPEERPEEEQDMIKELLPFEAWYIDHETLLAQSVPEFPREFWDAKEFTEFTEQYSDNSNENPQ